MSEVDENSQKLNPKDLVLFSTKTRQHIKEKDNIYLQSSYDNIDIPDYENDPKYRLWGLPYIKPTHPIMIGLVVGFTGYSGFNRALKRPPLTNIHRHFMISTIAAVTLHFVYKYTESQRLRREVVVWDYVKRHPEDFPEVFSRQKTFADVLLDWRKTL